MKQNILIIGLIDDFGGREIELRNIIVALSKQYNVRLISLLHMSYESVAIKGLNCNATTIFKELYNSNLILKILSFISKAYNRSKVPSHFLVENNLSKKLFNFYNKKVSLLEKEIDKSDAVLYCGVLDLYILEDIIIHCEKVNKPIVLRTTGTIYKVKNSLEYLLPAASTILVHSKSNAGLLNKISPKNIKILDQTTLFEEELLKIPIEIKERIVFGYLGRFSNEKGIKELLSVFKKNNLQIIVAGSGNLQTDVLDLIDDQNNFIGEISPENLDFFFKKIDILIIPSFEEAGPLVGIEAMAAGKIIFSTRVGAMEERLRETKNDFWFDIASENTFLEQLDRLQNITPEEIVTIRESNRKRYMENYSIKSISDQYLQVFEKVKVDNK
jgi:glycosyltransferase involved in cell wall biosynthesis